jgi:AAA domain
MSLKDVHALISNAKPVHDDWDDDEPVSRNLNGGNGEAAALQPIRFRPLAEIVAERRETRWLIPDVLEREVLAILAGPRSTFKSLIALDWMLRIALAGEPVVILSGEGAGLDRRADAWMRTFAPSVELASLPVVALERAVNLRLAETLAAVADACRALVAPPVATMIDTLSKFSPGMKENDNGEMSAFLNGLSEQLRDSLRSTVLVVAHSGHAEAGRPRGAYALMANPDAEYIVERPNPVAMTVTVTRDRYKDTAALPPLAYQARVIDLGRVDTQGKPVTSLVLDTTDAPPPTRTKGGKNQERGQCALREWIRVNPGNTHLSTIELHGLLKSQGITARNRRAEVQMFLVSTRVLSPAVGGYTVDPAALA